MPKPNTRDAMKRFRAGKAGFTDKAHLKAKGLIPRADGTKRKSPKYEELKVGDMVRYIGPERTGLKKGKIGSVVNKTSSGYQVDGMMMRSGVRHKESDLQKITKEDAPANATGTAVAGTGDDSSTVVVRRKKDKEKMKDRLLRRFKIKETIDRLVPAIEPPTDEVRERVDQLKELAKGDIEKAISIANKMGGDMTGAVAQIEKIKVGLSRNPMVQAALRQANEGFASAAQRRAAFASGYKAKGKKGKKSKKEDLEKDDEGPLKTVIKGLKKASGLHAKQAKSLEKQISDQTELEEAAYEVEAMVDYRGVRNQDEVLVVVDASSESDADRKAEDMIKKLRQQKKIGPSGGGPVSEIELGLVQRTSKRVGTFSAGMPNENELEEDMDRQPQDKDVKKVKGTQPKKYYKTLPKGLKKKRADFFSKQKYKKSDDDDDYKPAPGDKGAKTKPSIHTKKFKKLFGEIKDLNEKIKGLENKNIENLMMMMITNQHQVTKALKQNLQYTLRSLRKCTVKMPQQMLQVLPLQEQAMIVQLL